MCMCTDTLDSDVGLVAFFGDLQLSTVAVLHIIMCNYRVILCIYSMSFYVFVIEHVLKFQ